MTTRSLLLTLTFLGLPGCFLALDFDDDDRGQWSADDDDDTGSDDPPVDTDDTDDTDGDTDTSSLTLVVDPDELVLGTSTIVVFTVTSDEVADVAESVVSIDLGPDLTLGATRVLDGDAIAVTVDVPADAAEGPVDVTLDVEDVGVVVFRDALSLVAQ